MSRVVAITLLSNGSVFACIVVIFHCDKVFFCVLFLSCLSSISCLILLQQREPEYFRYFVLCSKVSKSIRLCRKLISFCLVNFPTLKFILKLESLLPTNYQTLKIKLYLSSRKKKKLTETFSMSKVCGNSSSERRVVVKPKPFRVHTYIIVKIFSCTILNCFRSLCLTLSCSHCLWQYGKR